MGSHLAGTSRWGQSRSMAPEWEWDTAARTWVLSLAVQGEVEDPSATEGIWESLREQGLGMDTLHPSVIPSPQGGSLRGQGTTVEGWDMELGHSQGRSSALKAGDAPRWCSRNAPWLSPPSRPSSASRASSGPLSRRSDWSRSSSPHPRSAPRCATMEFFPDHVITVTKLRIPHMGLC